MGLSLSYMFNEARRVLRQTRKPKPSEFQETAKITGLGIVVIGLIGFVIFIVAQIVRYIK